LVSREGKNEGSVTTKSGTDEQKRPYEAMNGV